MQLNNETVGDRIRKLRLHFKYSSKDSSTWNIAEFAKRCGISTSALSQIERNVIKNPSSDIIVKIAKELNVPVEYLLYGKTEKNKENLKIDIEKILKEVDKLELKSLNNLTDLKKRLYLKFLLFAQVIDNNDLLELLEAIVDQLLAFATGTPLDKKEIIINEEKEETPEENPYVSRVNDVIL